MLILFRKTKMEKKCHFNNIILCGCLKIEVKMQQQSTKINYNKFRLSFTISLKIFDISLMTIKLVKFTCLLFFAASFIDSVFIDMLLA